MTFELPAGKIATATAGSGCSGTIQRRADSGSTINYDVISVADGTSVSVGPFTNNRNYEVLSLTGTVTHSVMVPDEFEPLTESASTIFSNMTTVPIGNSLTIPAATQSVIFGELTINGTLTVLGALRIPSHLAT